MNEEDVRVAFGVEGFIDGETKDDPAYVKYLVRMYGKREGVRYERILDYHVCTAEELTLFGDPSHESIGPLEHYKLGGKKRLFCLDHEKMNRGDFSVWGTTNDVNYQRWEFVLLPCNYEHAELGPTGDFTDDRCNRDKTQ